MIIGRREETEKLRKAYSSDRSEFVVVYGRRRIGKTFLVRETFDYRFTFQYSGVFKVSNKKQLEVFHRNLVEQGLDPTEKAPKDWFDAFFLLQHLIERSDDSRKVIFIDELPWMDTRNSHFIPAFEHFWNGWASARKDVVLIICGSATSWIINKIFRNKGGLYNRATYRIKLRQFSLYECEELARHQKLPYNRNMLMEGYMVMGGVPYYWTRLDPKMSLGRNIDTLFLNSEGELRDEFSYIYSSMFNTPEKYIRIVQALSGKKAGLTRDDIISKAGIDNNGHVSRMLEDLVECGFVRKYCHTGKRLKDALYQLVDCYTLFYYQFVKAAHGTDEEFWARNMQTPTYTAWCGLAFERVCLLHTRQIKAAIGISGIKADLYSWFARKNDEHPGVQIDLIIDRADNIINICEMKYAPRGFTLTAAELQKINTRLNVFSLYAPRGKSIQPLLITSNGTIPNANSFEIPLQISGEQLFTP